ncbi:uncharacterized protein LOC134190056 [Corticium candelabrum]|uniref:uncharacterized protein LOC134190056 n=1 Tax=Corticium candelabrum TaxID=121492 RepID=UPI002E271927|nr:uncharacterized protein LOC134190056 [Corticium candelabrum]
MEAYREEARRKLLPEGYSGYWHLGQLFVGCLLVCLVCGASLESVTPVEWVTVPLMFLLGNGYEYAIHRYPGHFRFKFFTWFFKSHTGLHHRFYTYEHMQPSDTTDWYFTLFPNRVYASVIGLFSLVVFPICRILLTANAFHLAMIMAAVNLAVYELFHSFHHCSLPPRLQYFLDSLPCAELIRRHHRLHHHPRLMIKKNFNITFPIFDWICGTLATSLPS